MANDRRVVTGRGVITHETPALSLFFFNHTRQHMYIRTEYSSPDRFSNYIEGLLVRTRDARDESELYLESLLALPLAVYNANPSAATEQPGRDDSWLQGSCTILPPSCGLV